ncbi:SGNH/GDSL hydrolase family protein [Pararhizobium sp. BT-229]|uniref:SGNH/GDSL hydrolase family protein n=1 Tax=Pararhizobium sp. BT-229 TaxID=2986923 RepID=UPI0021F71EDD|nr:SGNH/GDSL hydrolase family protein [Pararhizobium sp. BT-229]MCV9960998.1 SGNH/GDSL hydrolase family protein [Pararhizobium sp. BT-229]
MTEGLHASSPEHTYPFVAGKLFSPPRTVLNRGVTGQKSTAIAARQGGLPVFLQLPNNEIAAAGDTAIQSMNVEAISRGGLQAFEGHIGNVEGTLNRLPDASFVFTRKSQGTAETCGPCEFEFYGNEEAAGKITWIWVGRNNAADGRRIEDDVDAMVKHVGHDRFLIASITTRASDKDSRLAAIHQVNANLQNKYGDRYVDVLSILLQSGTDKEGDAKFLKRGIVPKSLRSDDVHLNDLGYSLVAKAFVDRTNKMGW